MGFLGGAAEAGVLRELAFDLSEDDVLRGQGADPQALRRRRPTLGQVAAHALDLGRPLIAPAVAWRRLAVEGLRHERLELAGGAALHGPLLASHLGGAHSLVALACTIGPGVEQAAARAGTDDPLLALALDGLGSAAAEALAAAVVRSVEEEAALRGQHVSLPLGPGMIGWPVEQGQPELLALLDAEAAGVRLSAGGMMMPRKSLTFVLGVGETELQQGRACDLCALRETCRYQDHYPA